MGGRPIFDAARGTAAGLCQDAGFRLLIAGLFRSLRKYASSRLSVCAWRSGGF